MHRPPVAIDNEKARLKDSGAAPSVRKDGMTSYINRRGELKSVPLFVTDSSPRKTSGNYKYVRALFGTGETIRFNDENASDGSPRDVTVRISHNFIADNIDKEKRIARLSSPVFFKIINDYVFYVGTAINDSIYGKTFRFEGKKAIDIKVPEKRELPPDFMNDFMEYSYNRLLEVIRNRTAEKAFRCLSGMTLRKAEVR